MPPTIPTEHHEQVAVVRWLEMRGHLFCAVPNAAKRSVRLAAMLKAEGVRRGVCDLLIFSRANLAPFGCALEMKRTKGGRVTPEQRKWLTDLEALGWAVAVGHGAEDAIRKLQALGY